MFVVQNKETGLYCRNTSGGRGQRHRADGDWVADLQDVKPFRTMAAVRNNFMSLGTIVYDFSRPKWEKKLKHACCGEIKRSSQGGVTNKCEHYHAAVEARKLKQRAKYRVFKVLLVLGDEHGL